MGVGKLMSNVQFPMKISYLAPGLVRELPVAVTAVVKKCKTKPIAGPWPEIRSTKS